MKKNKFVLACLSGVLGLTAAVLTGCSNSKPGESGGTNITPGGNGGGNGGGGTTTETPETPANPVLKSLSNSFSGARVNYLTNNVLDENNQNTTFSALLDRQFSVLAEDILYRLYVTYGENTYGIDSSFSDLDLNYSYNGNNAKVLKNKLIYNLSEHVGNHKNVQDKILDNIDCPYCYQLVVNGESSRLKELRYINIQNAINGENYHWNSEFKTLISTNSEDNKWLFNDYSKWNTEYREQFKLALAKIVYGDENSTLSYNDLLNKINALGFEAGVENKIVNYINNNVIGSNLIEENLRIYNTFTDEDKTTIKIWSGAEEEKHLYKGYNIVVPAIVKQALNNTFENSNVGLYPVVSKQISKVVTLNDLKTENNYNSVVLMPNNSSVLVTKISAKFSSTNSVGKKVKVKATVKNATGNILSNKVVGEVTLSATGTQCELNFGCTNTIGFYTGSDESANDLKLFGNNTINTNLGNNYVQLTFECDNDVTFGVEFEGMYDKN